MGPVYILPLPDGIAARRWEGEMLRTLRLENLCPTVRLDQWPDLPEKKEHRLEERDVRSVRLYKAVVVGDLIELCRLLRKSYVDVDVFYSLSEELEWQARASGNTPVWNVPGYVVSLDVLIAEVIFKRRSD